MLHFWAAPYGVARADGAGVRGFDQIQDISQLDLEELLAAPVVISASRRAQSLHEAPAAVSVVTHEEIQRMGIHSPAEALERVVGVDVTRYSGQAFEVGMRGQNGIFNNRILVLADGMDTRSVWGPDQTSWSTIPLHVQDIEGIEVLRGPGSTLYGANAVSGVVNIQGRRPLNAPGLELMARAGASVRPDGAQGVQALLPIGTDRWGEPLPRSMMPTVDGFGAYGWKNASERLGIRISSFAEHQAEHFSMRENLDPQRDQRWGIRLALDYIDSASGRTELDLTQLSQKMPEYVFFLWAQSQSSSQTVRVKHSRTMLNENLEWQGQLDARHVEQQLKLTVLDLAEPSSQPTTWEGRGLLEGTAWLLNRRLGTTVGIEGSVEDNRYFMNTEARVRYAAAVIRQQVALLDNRQLRFNAGLRSEVVRIERADGVVSRYHNLNWRGGIIWQLDADQDLRLSASTAYRTPSPFQSLSGAEVSVPVLGLTEWMLIQARPDLRAEQALTIEAGYRTRLSSDVRAELVTYCQQITNASAPQLNRSYPRFFEDTHNMQQCGAEVDLRTAPTRNLSAYINYASNWTLQRSNETLKVPVSQSTAGEELVDESLFPPHIANLGVTWNAPGGFDVHARAHTALGQRRQDLTSWWLNTPVDNRLVRVDFSIARRFLSDTSRIQLTGRHVLAGLRGSDNLHETPAGHPTHSVVQLALIFDDSGET